jgi:rhodanese-related sulfurtransferase
MSRITEFPTADPTVAREHFERRLSLETDADDVAAAIEAGDVDFTLLDARSADAYETGHLPGALSLPYATIDAVTVAALPAGPLVVYCWGPHCNAAHKAAARLAAHGRAAKEMLGGIEAFDQAVAASPSASNSSA